MNDDKVKKLMELLKLLNDGISKEEFLKAFEQMRKVITDTVSGAQDSMMKVIASKLASVKDGVDGAKGDRGERGPVGRAIFGAKGDTGPQGPMGPQGIQGSPDSAEQMRDKLESLEGDERIDKSAIKGLEDELKRIESLPRGGGTSAMGVRQAFKLIAHTEQPTGLIDGANLTYTLKNDVWWLAGFTLNGEQIAQLPNYTIAGRTITFATALPADYSGKDFEVKYIG